MKVFKNGSSFVVTKDNKSETFDSYQNAAVHMYDLGVEWGEVEYGLTELITNDHSVAIYGVGFAGNGPKFCYSEKVA